MHALIGAAEPTPVKAIALLQEAGNSNVTGVVYFTQNATGSHTALHGIIQGLKPGLHGLHIHTSGDLSSGCNVLGTHYNPLNRRHNDNVNIDRHAGDLGNIQAAANGRNFSIPLRGANSILGRSIVVHDHADDLGRSEYERFYISGNAGGPVACGNSFLVPR
ncbi:hypothetical protein SELMODRAFT_107342 [Selaginella moellendorffii]|uniref:Superoxide dismutase copper/zinc binding domain-containing protein n=1 Tax=Selaginella moellendorffii TaxID=88036 RepID=D8S3J6_SELML|nr:hypothetical protein SELMODRAFT_107342 [Selaginella moellendorffii]